MAAAIMDEYLDSPLEGEGEDVFPCKGCGDILEEGKAFELAGSRWHLDCFRCNTCGTLLDSDANLLLLGDGSLICNNCTYSCSACHNKIEDLAILTGDQAFCATCFRCRNCKRKIENLRYAKTSQGIFCMSCHESLMARRRKRSKAAAQAKAQREKESPMITDKSLPALPPNVIPNGAFDDKASPDDDGPTELSPRPPRPSYTRNDSSRSNARAARSPERQLEAGSRESGLSLTAGAHRNNRNSALFGAPLDTSGEGDAFFIPVALDPSSAPAATPRSAGESLSGNARKSQNDYFTEKTNDSQGSTPHIAFQEKPRQTSSDYEAPTKAPARRLSKRNGKESRPKPTAAPSGEENKKLSSARGEDFKLQEAPKTKKTAALKRDSQTTSHSAENGVVGRKNSDPSERSASRSTNDKPGPSRQSTDSRVRDEEEVRPSIDSGAGSRPSLSESRSIARKEVSAGGSRNGTNKTGSGPSSRGNDEVAHVSRPSKSESRSKDQFMQPRAPPQPPSHTPSKDSVSSAADGPPEGPSPALPRWSSGADFSLEEDMARILGTDEGSTSLLRRVSNAVRHGRTNSTESSITTHQPRTGHHRSISESTRMTASPRWPKTPIKEDGQAQEISSPISVAAGTAQDDPAFLKRQLRTSEQRVAELERQFTTEKDLKNLNKKLIEKRKTVSVLDTQTEIMIRQLEVLAGYVERAKETKQPIDPKILEDSAIKDFVQKLEKVKQMMSTSIEQLHAERDELIDEKNQAIADREKAMLEFEQLSSKNAQLADMNNDLTHQIQERFKSQIGGDVKLPSSGLGIYHAHKGTSNSSVTLDSASVQTAQATLIGTDPDESVVETGPTVVNIRKGQVRKFNWKKGSKTVAHGLSKGVNRAVGAFQQQQQQSERDRGQYQGMAGDSIGLPYNMTVAQVDAPVAVAQGMNGANRAVNDSTRQGFGFFGKKGGAMPKSVTATNIAAAAPAAAEPPSTLFGSELTERANYEHRQIPSVVTRCIQEVEIRGMDIEGIYRKTGGNSQVKMIQEGFDKDEDYDISDPSLDITAVTSVLKQYFRKLPTPLLTFAVYDQILESNSITEVAERCTFLKTALATLPQEHRDTLEFLMFHLARVASREKENLMSPKNLAVCFAPTIMRDHSLEKEMTDMHAKNTAVQFIIEHSNEILAD